MKVVKHKSIKVLIPIVSICQCCCVKLTESEMIKQAKTGQFNCDACWG